MQLVLFVMFLAVYSLTVLGNTTLIALICNDSWLHTPMYFFIGNLSFLDLGLSTVYTPNIKVNCISEDKSISLAGCVCYLLAATVYDCYVAISKPLLYSQAKSLKLSSYFGGFINSVTTIKDAFTLNYCSDNKTDDFFCDIPLLVKLACGEESFQSVLFFLLTSNGRLWAFSSCSSHLISVKDKIISKFYAVFPMLNPLIYSLRNKDVKGALNKLLK
uniref:G-protein coupled receptors family 1 profile domain-containing protein n=1 Tax=Nannospalax galili TaxID=1026970 RepID=A0A8C6S1G1_NANGA